MMIAMFDKIGDLPSHPLIVHIPVVLLPLAAFAAVLYVARPRWRVWSRWWLAGFALVGCVGAWAAKQSGEHLRDRLRVDVDRHAGFGENAFRWSLALVVVVAACWILDELRDRHAVRAATNADSDESGAVSERGQVAGLRYTAWALYALLILVAAVVVAYVVAAGHSGAHMVWGNLPG